MQELLPGEASQPTEGQGEDALPGLRLSPSRLRLPVALLVAGLSGGALSLSLPPMGWWPLAFVAPIPLLWLVRGSRPRRGALVGFVFGVSYFGVLLYWILLFGELGFAALVLMSGGYLAVFGGLAPAIWRPERPVVSTVGLAALWTVIEWLRGAFPLGGFGWGQLGSTQVDAPALPLASITGVWGLSFLVLLCAGLVLLALERWGGGVVRPVALAASAVALALAPAIVAVPRPDGRGVDVAAIQVDVASVEHLTGTEEDVAVAALNIAEHLRLEGDAPDLAIWGEGALDPGALLDPASEAAVVDAIGRVGAPTVAGAVVNDADGGQRTATLAFDGTGRVVDRYDKVHLVPFGEYVPWRSTLERVIDAVDQIAVDRVPGDRVENVRIEGLPAFGTPICYENSFPGIDRAMVRAGAGFLVVTINNASYERTAASEQHLQMSRLRAVENGRWVVHAAVSGISAFIDPDGRVVDERGLFETAVMRRTIVNSTRTTLYTRFGDWVPWGSLALCVVLFSFPRRARGARRPSPELLPGRFRTLVVLPTYDERETIDEVLDGLLQLPHGVDALVVDDGSPDGTGAVVRARAEADPRIRLVERARKSGLASAYAAGFRTGLDEGYDAIVEMDSDLSHRPEQLPRLLDALQRHDVVVGSRYVPGGGVTNWSRARLALSRVGNSYARFCLGIGVHDATSGFRAYRRAALATIVEPPVRSDGYGFQVELVYRAWNASLTIGEAPISFHERIHGQSKISRRIVVEALWLVTLWGLRARLRPRPGA
ncbi:MAG: apolipoprotein N-acyltransferase [Actinomycetota bacterium]